MEILLHTSALQYLELIPCRDWKKWVERKWNVWSMFCIAVIPNIA